MRPWTSPSRGKCSITELYPQPKTVKYFIYLKYVQGVQKRQQSHPAEAGCPGDNNTPWVSCIFLICVPAGLWFLLGLMSAIKETRDFQRSNKRELDYCFFPAGTENSFTFTSAYKSVRNWKYLVFGKEEVGEASASMALNLCYLLI